MRRLMLRLAALAIAALTAPAAEAHAFLDHASPAVGSLIPAAPASLTLWFTQQIEPAFSQVTVSDQTGRRVDLGNAHVPPGGPDQLQVGLRSLMPGTYTVRWHVVSVDTHPTEGSFSFTVAGG